MADKPICVRPDGQCEECEMFEEYSGFCYQDNDEGCTGHGDISMSDADPGL